MENLLDNLKTSLQKDERLTSEGELLKNKIIELVLKLDKELIKLLLSDKKMKKAFLNYKVNIKTVDENAKDFVDLSINDQKKFLLECLDKNHFYVNYSETDDEEYGVSEGDKKLNKVFYKS